MNVSPDPFQGVEKLGHTIKQACHATGLGRNTIYNEIAAGRLKSVLVGRRRLITNVPEYMQMLAREADNAAA